MDRSTPPSGRSKESRRFHVSLENAIVVAVISAALLDAPAADALLKIGAAPTANMSCSNGVCEPTTKDAVLNVGDLENLLASGNVTVTTTGSGVEADDMHVNAALAWSNSSTLALQAHRSIEINAAVSIAGLSGLTLDSGSKGALSFGRLGNVTFANLSSSLVIDGTPYTLVADIKTLASDIANDANGNYALAGSYDASGDGTYHASPVSNVFAGTFEGLGNAISNLSINGGTKVAAGTYAALFVEIGSSAKVSDVGLVNVAIISTGQDNSAASLVGFSDGLVKSCFVTGKIVGGGRTQRYRSSAGGLVGFNYGEIANSHSAATVESRLLEAGGLVALSGGTINGSYAAGPISAPVAGGLVGEELGGAVADSYATGRVSLKALKHRGASYGGGLIGFFGDGGGDTAAAISNSYSTGGVRGPAGSYVGGLVGWNDTSNSTIGSSYSTGAVNAGGGSNIGGLIGVDDAELNSDTYWDTDTSGITNLSQGAGNVANDPGITGLTTAQFQSGLPAGFDPPYGRRMQTSTAASPISVPTSRPRTENFAEYYYRFHLERDSFKPNQIRRCHAARMRSSQLGTTTACQVPAGSCA